MGALLYACMQLHVRSFGSCGKGITNLPFLALLAVGVATCGMVGMFLLGNYLTQVIKAMKTDPSAKEKVSAAVINLTSEQLAHLISKRRVSEPPPLSPSVDQELCGAISCSPLLPSHPQAEIQEELLRLRSERPVNGDRVQQLSSELESLRSAANGPPERGGFWQMYRTLRTDTV